jgi:carbon monoxide dehydrogenase subunit G|tara:strand:- start:376 stop:798 length:423 start_codon:yes stop_codon:yes gene_type:complete
MAIIDTSIDINASVDKVWSIISDLDSEPKFWKGTKETRIISRDGNVITREITIAFRDSKCMQKITIQPKEKVHAEFTKGIIKGSKTLSLKPKDGGSSLEANWDVKMSGLAGMFTGMIKKHIRGGTEQALESIKQKAEIHN